MTGAPTARAESLGERLRWQQVLYAAAPQRGALRGLGEAPWPLEPLRIRVHRNHAVEAALTVAEPYLRFAGIAPDWLVGDYDDSLSFAVPDGADVELVWLDLTRFSAATAPADLAIWLAGRLATLRQRTTGPILVLDSDVEPEQRAPFNRALQDRIAPLREVHIASRAELFSELGERYFDASRERLTGTRMSADGALAIARRLGSWIPALLRPRLKAVVVDLDHTLYTGVLGEDGIDAVTLDPGHLELQRRLLALRESGLFLALASRNDRDQVEALFAARRGDFALSLEDFDATAISWQAKSQGLAAIAAQLRIDPSAILFVDDNPGELYEAALGAPGLSIALASPDGAQTAATVAAFPQIFSFATSEEDGLRSADLRANHERDRVLARADADLGAYHRELAVTLTVSHDRADQLARLADMTVKTNQFNLALARAGPADIEACAADPGRQASAARLSDRLTDSGVIAMLLARREGVTLRVEELCISCRAMGRGLEDLIVAQMLVSGPLFAGVETVVFATTDGPRNQPARDWLARFTGGAGAELSAERVLAASDNQDVRIEVMA